MLTGIEWESNLPSPEERSRILAQAQLVLGRARALLYRLDQDSKRVPSIHWPPPGPGQCKPLGAQRPKRSRGTRPMELEPAPVSVAVGDHAQAA